MEEYFCVVGCSISKLWLTIIWLVWYSISIFLPSVRSGRLLLHYLFPLHYVLLQFLLYLKWLVAALQISVSRVGWQVVSCIRWRIRCHCKGDQPQKLHWSRYLSLPPFCIFSSSFANPSLRMSHCSTFCDTLLLPVFCAENIITKWDDKDVTSAVSFSMWTRSCRLWC